MRFGGDTPSGVGPDTSQQGPAVPSFACAETNKQTPLGQGHTYTESGQTATVPKRNSGGLAECTAIGVAPTGRMGQLVVDPADKFRAQQNPTEWGPSCKGILYLLHKSDIAGRWPEVVRARPRVHKRRSARNLRYNLKLRERGGTMALAKGLEEEGEISAQCKALLQRYPCN